jgi:uncharacterized membrane protein YphA (DoxX/SURF4 family)
MPEWLAAYFRREIVMRTLAIVTTQLLLGLIVAAMGATVLAMPEAMAQRLAPVGLGDVFRTGMGGVQVVAGLCLMVPRIQLLGAAMLALMTVAVVVLGLLPSGGEASASVARPANRAEAAVAGRCGRIAPLAKTLPLDWRV